MPARPSHDSWHFKPFSISISPYKIDILFVLHSRPKNWIDLCQIWHEAVYFPTHYLGQMVNIHFVFVKYLQPRMTSEVCSDIIGSPILVMPSNFAVMNFFRLEASFCLKIALCDLKKFYVWPQFYVLTLVYNLKWPPRWDLTPPNLPWVKRQLNAKSGPDPSSGLALHGRQRYRVLLFPGQRRVPLSVGSSRKWIVWTCILNVTFCTFVYFSAPGQYSGTTYLEMSVFLKERKISYTEGYTVLAVSHWVEHEIITYTVLKRVEVKFWCGTCTYDFWAQFGVQTFNLRQGLYSFWRTISGIFSHFLDAFKIVKRGEILLENER